MSVQAEIQKQLEGTGLSVVSDRYANHNFNHLISDIESLIEEIEKDKKPSSYWPNIMKERIQELKMLHNSKEIK